MRPQSTGHGHRSWLTRHVDKPRCHKPWLGVSLPLGYIGRPLRSHGRGPLAGKPDKRTSEYIVIMGVVPCQCGSTGAHPTSSLSFTP
jgi:hypothetical protein